MKAKDSQDSRGWSIEQAKIRHRLVRMPFNAKCAVLFRIIPGLNPFRPIPALRLNHNLNRLQALRILTHPKLSYPMFKSASGVNTKLDSLVIKVLFRPI